MNRRGFLKIAFAAGVAVAAPAALADESLPRIVGDGVHDDTAGLQAAFDGKPFACRDDRIEVKDGHVYLGTGWYLISRPLRISGNVTGRGCDITLLCADGFHGPVFDLTAGAEGDASFHLVSEFAADLVSEFAADALTMARS